MPPVAGALGAVFLAGGAIAGAVAASVAVAGIALSTILTVAGVALMAVSYLTMKKPNPASTGQQLELKKDPKSPVPVVFGRTAVGGYGIYDEVWGADNKYLALAIALSFGGPIEAFHSHLIDDRAAIYSGNPETSLSTLTSVTGLGTGSKLFKDKTQLRFLKGEAPASTTISQAAGGGLPFSAGKVSGAALAVLKMEYDQEAFAQGLFDSKFVLSGVKLYDPRKDGTYQGGSGSHRPDDPDTWEFSENPFLQALHWSRGRFENGLKIYGIGAGWNEIDIPAFVEGANVCDANGWKSGGQVTTADDKYAVLSSILQAGGGLPIVRGAQISCLVNAVKTSVLTIQETDLIEQVDVQTTTSWRDRKNTLIPAYREEERLWEIVEGDQVQVQAYIDQDSGELREAEIEFPFCQDKAQAQQLAAYELVNMREFLTLNIVTKPLFLDVRVGDAVTVNFPSFEIANQKCVVTAREYDPQNFTVSFSLKQETDSKHGFALGQTAVAPVPATLGSSDLSTIAAPESADWTVATYTITDADQNKVPSIQLVKSGDISPLAKEVIVDFKKGGEPVWSQFGVYARDVEQIVLTGLEANTSYDVSIRYRSIRGPISERLEFSRTSGQSGSARLIDPSGNPTAVGDFAFLNDLALDDDRVTGTLDPFTQIDGTQPSAHGWSADGRLVSRPITNVAMTANAYRILASSGSEYYTVRSNVRYAGGMQIAGTLPSLSTTVFHGPAIGFTDRATITANNTEYNYLEYCFFFRYLSGAGNGDIQIRDDTSVITVETGLDMTDFDQRTCQVRYDGGAMEWLLDDVVVHSRFVGTGLELWTMISAREVGTGFEAIALTPYGAGAKVAGTDSVLEPDNANLVGYGNVIKKPVGAPNGYDGATSAVSYYRGAVISGKINSGLNAIALVDDPSPSSNGSDVYFGVFAVNGDVRIEIPNSAVVIGTTADYPLDGEWRIEYSGIEGRAFYNNTLVHTETLDSDKTLWGRGIVFLANTELNNVYFSAGQNENWDNIAGAGKPEDNATHGADFNSNLNNVPTELTDGRIIAGLDSSGDVARNLPTAIKAQISLDEVSDGSTNRFYTDIERSKLTSVEENATFGAVWGSNITNEPAALSDINSTEGTKLSGVEDNADVSADISGPSASNFRYSSTGVAENGQLSRDFTYDLTLASVKQTSGNTWTYKILSGTVNGFNASATARAMTGAGAGTLTVTSLGSDTAVVEINAVNGTKSAPAHKLTLTRSYAAPNNNGSSGGSTETASQTSGFTSFSSTAFAVVSNELTITAGSTYLEASVAMSVDPPSVGAWTIQAKLQRKVSGSWTDFGTSRSSTAEKEIEPEFSFEYPAVFNFTETATITASTTQEVRVLMRYSSGGSATFNPSGTFEIEG